MSYNKVLMVCLVGLCFIVSETYGASCTPKDKCDIQNNKIPSADEMNTKGTFVAFVGDNHEVCCQSCYDDEKCVWFEIMAGACFTSSIELENDLTSLSGSFFGRPNRN